jgi:hypothetical protein
LIVRDTFYFEKVEDLVPEDKHWWKVDSVTICEGFLFFLWYLIKYFLNASYYNSMLLTFIRSHDLLILELPPQVFSLILNRLLPLTSHQSVRLPWFVHSIRHDNAMNSLLYHCLYVIFNECIDYLLFLLRIIRIFDDCFKMFIKQYIFRLNSLLY